MVKAIVNIIFISIIIGLLTLLSLTINHEPSKTIPKENIF